ncbi:hypothetical protein [Haloarcula sp. Atlit-47R]|uniref:hypothetical protein n=1 Tax=Haloarcula sp. Atlit-47R TaxID=2282132 RepID=UPI0011C464AB|nr:hypothetical protein [Haloarcula sp. Atlit-47R]
MIPTQPDEAHLLDQFRDSGVTLGYYTNNNKLKSRVLSDDTEPIGELVDPLDNPGVTEDEHLPPALYDPLSRELYASPYLSSLSNQEPEWVESVMSHENIHAQISNSENHLYGFARLATFEASITSINMFEEFINDNTDWDGTVANGDLGDLTIGISAILCRSELAQEALAFRHQSSPTDESLLSHYATQFEGVTNSNGDSVKPQIDSSQAKPEHLLGAWLGYRLQEIWDIDVLNYAFGFVSSSGPMMPDDVLLRASTVNPPLLSELSSNQQRDLLKQIILEGVSENYQLVGDRREKLPGMESHTVDDYSRNMFKELIRGRCERGIYESVPIFANKYPGITGRKSLRTLLQEIRLISDGNNRKLILPSDVYKWAKGTKLLKMAVNLWELRERTILPIIRTALRDYQYSYREGEKIKRLIEDGCSTAEILETYDDAVDVNKINSSWKIIASEFDSIYREYSPLHSKLATLGKTIVEAQSGNPQAKSKIRTYI